MWFTKSGCFFDVPYLLKNCQGCEDETPVAKPISDNLGTYERDDEGEVSIFIPAGADFLLCYASEKSM